MEVHSGSLRQVSSLVDAKTEYRDEATPNFRFAAAVAGFGMFLKRSAHRGDVNTNGIISLAESGLGNDYSGYREQLIEMVENARSLGIDGA